MRSPRESLSLTNLRAWDHLYGNTRSLVWGDAPIGFLEEFLPALRAVLGPEHRALDAATGEGRNLAPLLRLNADLYACDGSAHAIEKIPAHLRRRVQTTVCDLCELPYADGFFDAALLTDVIETLPEPGRALGELHRVLSPRGLLLCNIPGLEDEIAGVDMEPVRSFACSIERSEGASTHANRFLFQGQYFYQFYTEDQAVELLTGSGFAVLRSEVRRWAEDPHPGFRGNWHWHTSRVFLVERR